VRFETDFAHFFLNSPDNPGCHLSPNLTCVGGTFDQNQSGTFSEIEAGPAWETSRIAGGSITGSFGQDVVSIGDVSLGRVQFGIAENITDLDLPLTFADHFYPALGLGLSRNRNEEPSLHYANLLDDLVQSGVIASHLYSFHLGGYEAFSGSILFGGVDKSRLKGDLVTVDMITWEGLAAGPPLIQDPITTITGLVVNVNETQATILAGGVDSNLALNNSGGAIPVQLTAERQTFFVPNDTWVAIRKSFPEVADDLQCPCYYRNPANSITLEIGGRVNITVPSTDFIVPAYLGSGEVYKNADGVEQCYFAIATGQSGGPGSYWMGDSVLRSMYIVVDEDNGQLSFAQAQSDPNGPPNIVTIGAGPDGLAKALSSSYQSAPPNTNSIATGITATAPITISTLATPIGTASGLAAVPVHVDYTPTGSVSSAASSTTTSAAASTTSHAAALGAPSVREAGALLLYAYLAVVGSLLVLGGAVVL